MTDTTILLSRPRKRAATSWSVFGDDTTPGDIVSTDAVAVERHHEYLARMSIEGVVPADVSAKARTVWELARKAVPGLPVPIAVAYDGGPIHYTWDNGRHQVTAEFHPGEMASDWFVRDRTAKTFDGGELSADLILPQVLIDCLRNTVG